MKKRFLLLVVSISVLMLVGGCSFLKSKANDANNTASPTVAPTGAADTSGTVKPTKGEYNYKDYITLGQYKGIEVTVDKLEVTDADIEKEIQTELEQNATQEEVTDRPVQSGDTVNIDYEGLKDGVAFEGGTAKAQDLTIGSNTFIPGFEDKLIGAKKGDKLKLDLTFPADYSQADLAGKAVVFNVTVNSIKKSVVPELTESYVKDKTEYATVDAYKQGVKEKLQKKNEDTMKQQKSNSVLSAIVEKATITSVPQTLIDYYQAEYVNYYTQYATMYGMDLAAFLSATNSTQADFDKEAMNYANSMGKQELVLKAIIAAENMSLSDQEYKDGVAKILSDYGYSSEDDLLKNTTKDQIKENLLWQKAIDFVTAQAVEKQGTADSLNKQ